MAILKALLVLPLYLVGAHLVDDYQNPEEEGAVFSHVGLGYGILAGLSGFLIIGIIFSGFYIAYFFIFTILIPFILLLFSNEPKGLLVWLAFAIIINYAFFKIDESVLVISDTETIDSVENRMNHRIGESLSDYPGLVKADIVLEKMENREVVKVEYNFASTNESLYAEIGSYEPGQYHLADSELTQLLLKSVEETIDEFFDKYLEYGEELQVNLYGFTDSLKYNPLNPSYYDGLEGDFPKKEGEPFKIYDYFLNSERIPITLTEGDELNNNLLGFLRAYCMYDESLKHNRELRKESRNTSYVFHSISNTSKSGSDFRKTGVMIEIINVSGEQIIPSPGPSKCSRWYDILLLITGFIFSVFIVYHYKKFHDHVTEKDEIESIKKQHHRKMMFIWGGLFIFNLIVLYFLCPSLLFN